MFSGSASDLQAQVMPVLHAVASPPQGSDAEPSEEDGLGR